MGKLSISSLDLSRGQEEKQKVLVSVLNELLSGIMEFFVRTLLLVFFLFFRETKSVSHTHKSYSKIKG